MGIKHARSMPRVVCTLSMISALMLTFSTVPRMATARAAQDLGSAARRTLAADSWFCIFIKAQLECVPHGTDKSYCAAHSYCLDNCGITVVTAYGPGTWEQDYTACGDQSCRTAAILSSPYYRCSADNTKCADASMLAWSQAYSACAALTSQTACNGGVNCRWQAEDGAYSCVLNQGAFYASDCPSGNAAAPRPGPGAIAVLAAGLIASTFVVLS